MVKPYLEEVYAKTQEAKRQALDFGKLKKTPLKLGVMCTIQPDELVELVSGLQTRHPGIELEIVDASASDAGGPAPQRRPRGRDLLHPGTGSGRAAALHAAVPGAVHDRGLARSPLASLNAIHPRDLTGERYLNRISCEFYGYAGAIWRENGFEACEMVYRSERDDWILAMIAAGLGFGFMPQSCVKHPMVVARPIVDPEFWREVNLVTVRGRPHSPAVGALVKEAMRARWLGRPAIAAEAERVRAAAELVPASAE